MEPNSSSEVEPYSGGRRLHLLLLDTMIEVHEKCHLSVKNIVFIHFQYQLFIKQINVLVKLRRFVSEEASSRFCSNLTKSEC